jgi:predicted enzyme related to lactoylglutathione lyase
MTNPNEPSPANPANSPIENRIGAVFVPVSDMPRAVEWYSRLLGTPTGETTHEGRIFDMPMQGTGLILDSHRPVANSSQPLFFLWTQDIHATHRFLLENSIDVLGDIEHIGSVSTLRFRDPDGNLLMVCQRNLLNRVGA